MTQVEKELLLKDLAQRLPYRVMVHTDYDAIDCPPLILKYLSYNGEYYAVGGDTKLRGNIFSSYPCKPYLRPMSSMTEDEIMEERSLLLDLCREHIVNQHIYIDWLNAHYLDYRGLIAKGLALEAPEGMYNY